MERLGVQRIDTLPLLLISRKTFPNNFCLHNFVYLMNFFQYHDRLLNDNVSYNHPVIEP